MLAELRIAARSLAKRPGWTLTVVATLTLGLGGAFAVGNIAYGILLRPLPYPEPDRLVRIYETNRGGGRMNVADPNYADLAALDGLFAGTAQFGASLVAVDAGGGPQRRMGASVSGELFDLLGVRPVEGRLFSADERRPGGAAVALVSETLWSEWRPASGDLADLRLEIDGTPFAVVGVLPAEFDFPFGAQLWAPRELDEPLPSRTAHNFPALARLRDGVSLTAARDGVAALARRLIAEHGDDVDLTGVALVPLLETQVAPARPALLLVLGASAFLLVVAVVNVASLLFARFRGQQPEIATRIALGAGDRWLARHFLGEWLLLALPGALGGSALASAAIALLRRYSPRALPRLDAVELDSLTLGGAVVLIAAVSLALVLGALLRARRLHLETALREGSLRAIGAGRGWLRSLPLGVQAAATFLLLAAVALVGTSLQRLLAVEPGFRTTGVDVVDLYPPSAREEAAVPRRARELDALIGRLRQLPAADEVGLISTLPLSGGGANGTFIELGESAPPASYEEFGALMKSGLRTGDATYLVASEGYFRALGIALREGRLFDARDTLDAPHVALVSESLAHTIWPGESALGRRLEFGNMDGDLTPLEVIGVVADARHDGLSEPPPAIVYTNYRQRPQGAWAMSAVVARGQEGISAGEVRSAVESSLAGTPWRLRRIDDVLAASVAERRLLLALLATFGGIALALAAAGIFGAVAVAVAERRREYALRLALGARENGIRALALKHGLVPTLAGVAAGAVAALAAGRLLASLLFEIRPNHPPALAAAFVAVGFVALAAAWLPARRAGAAEPASLLRAE